MIKVCEQCSKVNMEDLTKLVPEGQLTVKCLGHCEGHDGKSFGLVNDELVIADSPEAFTQTVIEKLK